MIPELQGLKGIIFDCDGVVIDSWESTRYFFNRIREGVGLPPMSPEQEKYVFVSTVDEGIEHIVPQDLKTCALEVKRSITVEDLLPHLREQPGIRGFLRELKKRGLRAAVNTNGGAENTAIFAALELLEYFDAVVTADDVVQGKPAPDGVFLILDALGLAPEDTVFIGDSHIDQATASAAGLTFWSYCNPKLQASLHLKGFIGLERRVSASYFST